MRRCLIAFLLLLTASIAASQVLAESRSRHFAANGNFDSQGTFLPAQAGFNLADVSSRAELDRLPEGVKGLMWMGRCKGADATFQAIAGTVIDDPRLYGFYLMDDPDPTGRWRTACPAAALREEADWIHSRRPEAIAFVALMNLGSSSAPVFSPNYAPEFTHLDAYGIAPYPCRTGWARCDLGMIDQFVAAAQRAGVPLERIAPTYQAFGGGSWRSDDGGSYRMPTVSELKEMLSRWRAVAPSPLSTTPIPGARSVVTRHFRHLNR
jgi:hypothetical protein